MNIPFTAGDDYRNARSGEVEYARKALGKRTSINHDEIVSNVHVGSVPITDADFRLIVKEGFGALVDLCEDNKREKKTAKIFGLDYYGTFVPDGCSPRLEQFKDLTRWIHDRVKAGTKVYVHCHAGAGRAPTIVAAYLLTQGYGLDNALNILEDRRRYYQVSGRQERGLAEFQSQLQEA